MADYITDLGKIGKDAVDLCKDETPLTPAGMAAAKRAALVIMSEGGELSGGPPPKAGTLHQDCLTLNREGERLAGGVEKQTIPSLGAEVWNRGMDIRDDIGATKPAATPPKVGNAELHRLASKAGDLHR